MLYWVLNITMVTMFSLQYRQDAHLPYLPPTPYTVIPSIALCAKHFFMY